MKYMQSDYTLAKFDKLFPAAARYTLLSHDECAEIHDGPLRAVRPFTERHLQCVWFDSSLRPKNLKTVHGESISVLNPGRWNLESGPDFIDAVLDVGPEKRRLCGDIELHTDPSDWIQHGHGDDPRYRNLIAHVTFSKEQLPAGILPRGCLQMSLKKSLLSNPYFAFENIDVTAYPYNTRPSSTPCSRILKDKSRQYKEALLMAAGQERIRRKSEVLLNSMREEGVEQALYTEIMRALGYKNNKSAFKYLAESLRISALREESDGDILQAYALLMGISRLLPETIDPGWDRETTVFVRDLWDRWWRMKERWGELVMDAGIWSKAGLRPQNRPERRLMAAAALFTSIPSISKHWLQIAETDARDCISTLTNALASVEGPYWGKRLAWSGKLQSKSINLIGKSRANAIAVNVFIPFLAAKGCEEAFSSDLLAKAPAEPLNAIMRETAHTLFGPTHPPALYKGAVRRQGLMQIFQDYCLGDRSGCEDCRFPILLNQFFSKNEC